MQNYSFTIRALFGSLISVCSFKYYFVCLTAAPNQGKTLLKHDFSQTEMQIILWELFSPFACVLLFLLLSKVMHAQLLLNAYLVE